MNKKVGITGVLGITALLLIASFAAACEWEECLYWSADVEVDLIAGQTIDAGDVHIWIDSNMLYIEFETSGDWVVTETHYVVGTEIGAIPVTNKGSPKIGQFPGGETYDPPVTTDIYCEDLGDYNMVDMTDLFIAFHAVVKILNGCGEETQAETAWGDGDPFLKGWGMYIHFKVAALPCYQMGDNTVGATINHWYSGGSGESYWEVVLDQNDDDVKALGHLQENYYLGWCIESGVTIGGGFHQFGLWSSHLPNLPKDFENYEWDKINWVLNYKNENPTLYTAQDVQQAIWTLTSQTFPSGETYTDDAKALVALAHLHGDGFYPGEGDVFAVILYKGDNSQMIIIEVDP